MCLGLKIKGDHDYGCVICTSVTANWLVQIWNNMLSNNIVLKDVPAYCSTIISDLSCLTRFQSVGTAQAAIWTCPQLNMCGALQGTKIVNDVNIMVNIFFIYVSLNVYPQIEPKLTIRPIRGCAFCARGTVWMQIGLDIVMKILAIVHSGFQLLHIDSTTAFATHIVKKNRIAFVKELINVSQVFPL